MESGNGNGKKIEPDLEKDTIINNRYIILRKIGDGNFSKVYLVLDQEDKEKYAAKILLESRAQLETKSFEYEIKILKKLTEKPKLTKYVNQYHDSGIGDAIKDKFISKDRYYLISNYFSKKNLFTYLDKTQEGFEEKHIKIIFSKILECFQYIHSKDICHLDIKLENIMLDPHFIPIIIDFGLSYEMEKDDKNNYKLIDDKVIKGSPYYISPQIWNYRKYNGIKADIFSLGVLLFFLATKHNSFTFARRSDPDYKLICLNQPEKLDEFWEHFANLYPQLVNLSPEFKDLFLKMIAYREDRRPESISKIFEHPWMNDVKSFTEKDYLEYENMMNELEDKVSQDDETFQNVDEKIDLNPYSGNRSGNDSDEDEKYFDSNILPKYLSIQGLNAMNYIKIKGDLQPYKFMNSLANKLEREFDCKIYAYIKDLIFEATFPNKLREEYESLEEIEEEEIEGDKPEQYIFKDCVIKIEFFEYINGGHEVHFTKREGEFMDYYSYFQQTKNIIKNILNISN